MPRDIIASEEIKLVRSSDYVFVTAPNLFDTLSAYAKKIQFYPNVADYEHFHLATRREIALPVDIANILNPRIGFVGAVSSYKLNMELICQIADLRPQYSFVFLGDVGEGEQLWFVLPSCRAVSPEDERRDPCPIDRLEVSAVGGGAVRVGRMTTTLDGEVPRRVQAVAVEAGTRIVRVRMVTPSGNTRFDGVIRVADFGELPVPVGARTATGFALDFREYPGR